MKPRVLYIMFALIIIIILLTIWISRESELIQPVSEEKSESPQTTMEQRMLSDFSTQTPVPSENKSAITIIKQPKKEKPVPFPTDLVQQLEKTETPEIQTTSHKSSSTTSRGDTESTPGETDSGITIIDTKHPSEAEQEEMNQRGIMMW